MKYSFYLDHEIKTWRRDYYNVEADSPEKAKDIFVSQVKKIDKDVLADMEDDNRITFDESEILYENEEELKRKEVYDSDSNLIYVNE